MLLKKSDEIMEPAELILDDNDPGVIAARQAEKELFALYNIKSTDHYVLLKNQNIKVRVCEIGSGDPVFIVPGNTGDVFPLTSLLAQLKGRRIIAINRLGGGLSEGIDHMKVNIRHFAVNTLDTVLETFKLQNIDIVAHSIGAHWSLWLAMDRPKRVRSLTLLGNPGNVMQGKPPFIVRLISKPPLNKLFLKLLLPSDKDKALNPLTMAGHNKSFLATLPKALRYCYYYFGLLPHYKISLMSLMENAAPKIDKRQLQQIQQPAQLLLGDKDTFASVAAGKDIVAALPNGRLHVLKGAGHLPWLESPDECGKIIMEFLRQAT